MLSESSHTLLAVHAIWNLLLTNTYWKNCLVNTFVSAFTNRPFKKPPSQKKLLAKIKKIKKKKIVISGKSMRVRPESVTHLVVKLFFFFGYGKPSTYWCLLSGACLVKCFQIYKNFQNIDNLFDIIVSIKFS